MLAVTSKASAFNRGTAVRADAAPRRVAACSALRVVAAGKQARAAAAVVSERCWILQPLVARNIRCPGCTRPM